MAEVWEKAPVEVNGLGVEERNIWNFDLVTLKKRILRGMQYVMFTEAWIGRWDLFAYEVYRDQYLWFVVPVINDVMNLFVDPAAGVILKVPHALDVIEWMKWGE